MVTNTHHQDYRKNFSIVPALVPVCGSCGGNVWLRPGDAQKTCIDCGSTNVVEVWEHMLDTFRRGLRELKQRALINSLWTSQEADPIETLRAELVEEEAVSQDMDALIGELTARGQFDELWATGEDTDGCEL